MVVSRDALIQSKFSTVICAPVHTRYQGLATEVMVGAEEGLRHDSSILCDALVSVPKLALTDFVGTLSQQKIHTLDAALRVALAVEDDPGAADERRW